MKNSIITLEKKRFSTESKVQLMQETIKTNYGKEDLYEC